MDGSKAEVELSHNDVACLEPSPRAHVLIVLPCQQHHNDDDLGEWLVLRNFPLYIRLADRPTQSSVSQTIKSINLKTVEHLQHLYLLTTLKQIQNKFKKLSSWATACQDKATAQDRPTPLVLPLVTDLTSILASIAEDVPLLSLQVALIIPTAQL